MPAAPPSAAAPYGGRPPEPRQRPGHDRQRQHAPHRHKPPPSIFPISVPTAAAGSNGNASFNNGVVTLTPSTNNQDGSVFYNSKVPTTSFTASFVYQESNGSNPPADGVAFVVQNVSTTALGTTGSALGYNGGLPQHGRRRGNQYQQWSYRRHQLRQRRRHGTYVSTGGVNVASGDPILVNLSYNGTTLLETLTDETTHSTYTTSYTANIPADAGGNMAYVGFTGATGGTYALQQVSQFSYQGGYNNALTVPAAANSYDRRDRLGR